MSKEIKLKPPRHISQDIIEEISELNHYNFSKIFTPDIKKKMLKNIKKLWNDSIFFCRSCGSAITKSNKICWCDECADYDLEDEDDVNNYVLCVDCIKHHEDTCGKRYTRRLSHNQFKRFLILQSLGKNNT